MSRWVCKIVFGVAFSISSMACMACDGRSDSAARPVLTYACLAGVMEHGSTDEIISALNQAQMLNYQGEVLPFIQDLYLKKKEKYPKVNWREIELPIVRVKLANVLLQARRNSIIRFDVTSMHAELRRALQTSDRQVVWSAITTIAFIDDDNDVDLIYSFALHEDDTVTFRTAVSALLEMCSPRVTVKLSELAARVKKPADREFILKSGKDFEGYRISLCQPDRVM